MRLRTVELLRGIAALAVLLTHSTTIIPAHGDLPFKSFHNGFIFPGGTGVEFFFVLSGFIMVAVHGQDIGKPGRIPNFAWRRITRIYPLFWLVLAEPCYRYWGAPIITAPNIANWASLLPISDFDILPGAWSLRYELTYYILFALLLTPAWSVVLAVWAAGTLLKGTGYLPWDIGLTGWTAPLGFAFGAFTIEFFAGLLAGALFTRLTISTRVAVPLLCIGLVGLLWRMSHDGWGMSYGPFSARFAYGGSFGAILLALAVLEQNGRIRLGRWAVIAGALSYPLYRSHTVTLYHLSTWLGRSGIAARMGQDAFFAIALLSALAVAAILAYGVDRPFQRLLRTLSRSTPGRSTLTPAQTQTSAPV